MARITDTERNFWLNYFRGKVSEVLNDYRDANRKFLQEELPAQAEAKAYELLGIVTLLATHEDLDKQIDAKRKSYEIARNKLNDKHNEDIKPLEAKLNQVYAKRIAKVLSGNVSGWARYDNGQNRQPYEYDTKIRDVTNNASDEIYKASEEGKHISKLEKQYKDVPVALMLATSRLEMANAVRQMAVVIGIDLPITGSLEDLT